MDVEEFRACAHQLIDTIADYHAGVADLPVMSQVMPGEVLKKLPAHAPVSGESFERIMDDFNSLILPGLSHWQHPGFYGYFPANAALPSILGDFLSTGLGVLGLSWQSSPALTELEEKTVDWMRELLGLSSRWSGVIQDTASMSALISLISAREKTSRYSLAAGGVQAEVAPLIVYTSAHSHSSVDKAALLAGFGKDNIRYVPTDENYSLDPAALEAAIIADKAGGFTPCAVVATVGTTTSTAIDPIKPISQITQKFGLWLHVDCAMAGSAMILPEYRWMWEGIEQADSLVINAHKWLGVAFDCSLYYVKDAQHLIRVMSTNPTYLQTSVDSEVKNLRDWGVPLGRRFRALKLWFLLRSEGVEKIQKRLRRDLDNAQWLATAIKAAPNWKLLAPVSLQTLCIRYEPAGLHAADLDAFTLAWAEKLNRSGFAYVTPATLDDRWMVRVSIGAIPTEQEHVASLWQALQQTVIS